MSRIYRNSVGSSLSWGQPSDADDSAHVASTVRARSVQADEVRWAIAGPPASTVRSPGRRRMATALLLRRVNLGTDAIGDRASRPGEPAGVDLLAARRCGSNPPPPQETKGSSLRTG